MTVRRSSRKRVRASGPEVATDPARSTDLKGATRTAAEYVAAGYSNAASGA